MDNLTERAMELLFGLSEATIYLLVGILTWAEAAFFLGFVTPGEIAVATGGVLASRGQVSLVGLAAVATLGTILGNTTGYWLGRMWGTRFLEWRPLQRWLGRPITTARDFMERRGEWAIVVGRLATATRIVVPFLAGASKLPYRRFLAFDIPAGLAWAAAWATIGFTLGESWTVLLESAGDAAFLVLSLFVLALVIRWVAVRVARNPRPIQAGARWMLQVVGVPRIPRALIAPLHWIDRRLNPRLGRGLGLTLGFALLLAGAAGAGVVLNQIRVVSGLVLLDFPALVWMRDMRTDEAVLVARAFLTAFHWPGVILWATPLAAILAWRWSGPLALRWFVGLVGAGFGAFFLDRMVLEGVVPGAEYPSVPVAVAAALLVHATAGAGARAGWGPGVKAGAAALFLVCTVAMATLVAGWAAPSGIALGLAFGLIWAAALEVQARLLQADRPAGPAEAPATPERVPGTPGDTPATPEDAAATPDDAAATPDDTPAAPDDAPATPDGSPATPDNVPPTPQ